MTVIDMLAANLEQNQGMLKQHLADFSDADMLVRPVPGANHAAWQVGHLLAFEAMLCAMYAPAAIPTTSIDLKQTYGTEGAKIDDPAKLLKKDELLKLLDQTHSALVAWARTLSPEDLAKPGPEEFKGWVNTLGDLLLAIAVHATMHVGQFQVIRRKLGKKVLF